ncbi:MAG: 3-dehydroquinate synthase [Lachnospiraceae bacterium]|nr:3-dehydroquinate synthase [Lachnospiraceae bacterium]
METKILPVKQGSKVLYDIVISDGMNEIHSRLEELGSKERTVVIITDSNVDPLYGDQMMKALKKDCKELLKFVIPAGEDHKNLATVETVYEFLIQNHVTRTGMLIALGGGVVGDMTGFVAATYLRGIDFIQVPTTLLAQVDSSVGGKTGVDFQQYKNMVGAFYMPRLVYMDLSLLKSLDDRQFASGFAETMKYGLIKDAKFYSWLIENSYEIEDRDMEVLAQMIYTSCDWKRKVVEKDPTEKGDRALLNYGHTIGHAIEKAMNFQLLHGECVALGSVCAAYISYKHDLMDKDEYLEVRDMFVPFHLPISITDLDEQEVLKNTYSDKKVSDKARKFILLKHIGRGIIDTTVTDEEILESLREIIYKPGED